MTPPASWSAAELRAELRSPTELAWLQRQVREFAAARGLAPALQWALAIAASEAATNFLKFAGSGLLTVRVVEGTPRWVELEARDRGPGIADPAAALEDGVSEGVSLANDPRLARRRGLGLGLGAIRRLTDRIEIRPNPGGGTILLARKRLEASER